MDNDDLQVQQQRTATLGKQEEDAEMKSKQLGCENQSPDPAKKKVC